MHNNAEFYTHPLFQSNTHTFTIPRYCGLIWIRADEVSKHNLPSSTCTIDNYNSDRDDDELFEDDNNETMHGALRGDPFDPLHSRCHSSSNDSSSDLPCGTRAQCRCLSLAATARGAVRVAR
jgi:hypothetical protein